MANLPTPPPPAGLPFNPIQNYQQLKADLDWIVRQRQVDPADAPHGVFWDTLTCQQFTTGNVPSVFPATRICIPGNSAGSAIIQILQAPYKGFRQMPGGGPYLWQDWIDVIANWIDSGCPC
jgi:hypothetical protein